MQSAKPLLPPIRALLDSPVEDHTHGNLMSWGRKNYRWDGLMLWRLPTIEWVDEQSKWCQQLLLIYTRAVVLRLLKHRHGSALITDAMLQLLITWNEINVQDQMHHEQVSLYKCSKLLMTIDKRNSDEK